MFFRRNQKPTVDITTGDTAPVAAEDTAFAVPSSMAGAVATEALPVSALRRTVEADALGFTTTADIKPIAGLIGQDRALRALEFGASMTAYDFNVFVLGPAAAGKRTVVKALLAEKSKTRPAPSDWIYVTNFDDALRPKAIQLPHGRARAFGRAMLAALDELRMVVPQVFTSDDYQARRRAIDERFEAIQSGALAALEVKAKARNMSIIRTPQGFAVAPIHDGKVVKPETFAALPEAMRAEKEVQILAVEAELQAILMQAPAAEKQRRVKLTELHEDLAKRAVATALEPVSAAVADVLVAASYLELIRADLIRNIAIFLPPTDGEAAPLHPPADAAHDPRFRRYMVNVLGADGDGTETGAPVIDELNPSTANLIGRMEPVQQMGNVWADALIIKAGALHRANGGYLIVDARLMLDQPFAWEALKRALKTRELRVELPPGAGNAAVPNMLEPQPIPLDVKVFLIGDRELYYKLAAADPDFGGLFKVQAEFDDAIVRTTDTDRAFAGIMASLVVRHSLKPVDASGIARMIEEASRMADHRDKISIEIGRMSDILREADYWATAAKHAAVGRDDVARAVAERADRADRMRDQTQEQFGRGTILLDTAGQKVGQINGLSVLQLGDFAFGRPTRITARVRLGSGRVTDIEREANLGGPLHTKGMMILWGFLAGRYAQDIPLALAASIVFEQSYGGVDGDSASSTELYALLSALAEAPLKQSLAVTGSVNQSGEVQAIGGVNEKIEGFFDVCKARGFTGGEGVMIPKSNVDNLMLREDVVASAKAGQFHIYPIATIDEGLTLLTGVEAGQASVAGHFPPDTINGRVEARLRTFAARAHEFGQPVANVRHGDGAAS
jgi:predicted ATP-dependent protease